LLHDLEQDLEHLVFLAEVSAPPAAVVLEFDALIVAVFALSALSPLAAFSSALVHVFPIFFEHSLEHSVLALVSLVAD
jgi:hypothetical protein